MKQWCALQVGATAFVGLLEGGRGISWTVLSKAIFGWVFTLIVVGFFSALLMALGIHTPNLNSLEAVTNIKERLDTTAMETISRYQELPVCEGAAQSAALNVSPLTLRISCL